MNHPAAKTGEARRSSSRHVTARLPIALFFVVREAAAREQMTVSGYISKVLLSAHEDEKAAE